MKLHIKNIRSDKHAKLAIVPADSQSSVEVIDGTNPASVKVGDMASVCLAPLTKIYCTDGTSLFYTNGMFNAGVWDVYVAGELVAEQLSDSYAIRDFFNANPEYQITHEVISTGGSEGSGGSGSGSGSGTLAVSTITMNHNADIGQPIEFINRAQSYVLDPYHFKGNSTIVVEEYSVKACLNKYSPLTSPKVDFAINGWDVIRPEAMGITLSVWVDDAVEPIVGTIANASPAYGGYYPWESAELRGLGINIIYGVYYSSVDGGTPHGTEFPTLQVANGSTDTSRKIRISSSAIVGVWDGSYSQLGTVTKNAPGDYSLLLGPFYDDFIMHRFE